jgi:hypothetical protein
MAATLSHISHATGFLQAAYTILLSLALGEAFKQIISDDPDKEFRLNRLWGLAAFLFMIFPFFHGMSRYLFLTYLSPSISPQNAISTLASMGSNAFAHYREIRQTVKKSEYSLIYNISRRI